MSVCPWKVQCRWYTEKKTKLQLQVKTLGLVMYRFNVLLICAFISCCFCWCLVTWQHHATLYLMNSVSLRRASVAWIIIFVWTVKYPPPVRLLAHSRDWLNLAQSKTTKCWRQTAAGTIDQSLHGRGVSPAIYSTVEHRAGLVWRTSPLSGQITRSLQGFWSNMSKEVSVASGTP